MPVHDWTKVEAGIFHDFHHEWISSIKHQLNERLPADYYALAEQIVSGLGPDVLALRHPSDNPSLASGEASNGGAVALATRPPKVRFRQRIEESTQYAAKSKQVVIRHRGGHEVIAVVEIVSPGNKSSRRAMEEFVDKAVKLISGGVHLLIIDLFAPPPHAPSGLHGAIWEQLSGEAFELPADEPLTLSAYNAAWPFTAYAETTRVGGGLPEMPVFLDADHYVPLELEPTYARACDAVPRYWRERLQSS